MCHAIFGHSQTPACRDGDVGVKKAEILKIEWHIEIEVLKVDKTRAAFSVALSKRMSSKQMIETSSF